MQRVRGKYRVQMRVGGRKVSHTFTNKRDAEKKENELNRLNELYRAGMQAPKDSVLWQDYARRWLRKRVKEIALSSFAMEESRMRLYLLEPLANFPLPSITSGILKDLLDQTQIKNKLSNATRNRIRAMLHTMFQDAFEAELVVVNPMTRVPLLSETPSTRPDPLTKSECDRLIQAAKAFGTREVLLVSVMIFEGQRVSQAVAIQNHDFDLELNELHIRRIFEQESGEIVNRIKGRPDGIVIPLFPRCKDAYREHLKNTPFKSKDDFCICDDEGKPISTYSARRIVRQICKDAEVREITPHVLRATFATLAEEAGFSKEDVQRMLGHSSVLVTQRYTRRGAQPLVAKGKELGFGESEDT